MVRKGGFEPPRVLPHQILINREESQGSSHNLFNPFIYLMLDSI